MIYGLIITAGKQSRFKSDIPKALVKYNGNYLLDLNIKNMNKYCDKVYVVCSYDNKNYFKNYNQIIIYSGFGCGDAVMKALNQINLNNNDTVFIQWGDCLHKHKIYRKTISAYHGEVLVPCVLENKPYVQIIQNGDYLKVLFSKYDELTNYGYHDLSLFYGNALYILKYLNEFHNKIWHKNKYIHRHGNEMQFLDVFNSTQIKGKILNMKHYKSFSFNTIEELKELEK